MATVDRKTVREKIRRVRAARKRQASADHATTPVVALRRRTAEEIVADPNGPRDDAEELLADAHVERCCAAIQVRWCERERASRCVQPPDGWTPPLCPGVFWDQ
jgi:hypothetical protein